MEVFELEKCIYLKEIDTLINKVATLTESERRKFSTPVQNVLKLIRRMEREEWSDGEKKATKELAVKITEHGGKVSKKSLNYSEFENCIALALVACCPLSAVKRARFWGHDENFDVRLLKIIEARKPDWLQDWIEWQTDQEFSNISWHLVAQLIHKNLIRRPTSDGYIRLMINGIPDITWQNPNYKSLSQKIRENSWICDYEIWRLFEIDGYCFGKDYMENSRNNETPKNYESWTTALIKLSNEGLLERQKLLDKSLAGLSLGLKNNTLSGFITFFQSLDPSQDEINTRHDKFIDLLNSQVSHVLTFALNNIKKIEKTQQLNTVNFLEYSDNVFNHPTKTQALSTLQIYSNIARQSPQLARQVCQKLCVAVTHQNIDIQNQSIELLILNMEHIGENEKQLLADSVPTLGAEAQQKLGSLLAGLGGSLAEPAEEKGESLDLDLYREWMRGLTAKQRALLGLQDFDFENITALTPQDFHNQVPKVDSYPVIDPVETVEELISELAHLIEITQTPTQMERLLDGISRHVHNKPEDFEIRVAPLIKRINNPVSHKGLISAGLGVHNLVNYWLGSKSKISPDNDDIDYGKYISLRCNEIYNRISNGVEAPVLSFPTHEGGILSIQALIQRLQYYIEKNIELPVYDFIQALFRLDIVDARKNKDLITGDHYALQILKWTCGVGDKPSDRSLKNLNLWLAASRVRDEYGENTSFPSLSSKFSLASQPIGYHWRAFSRKSRQWDNEVYKIPDMEIQANIKLEKNNELQEFPHTVLLPKSEKYYFSSGTPIMKLWYAWYAPNHLDPFLVIGIRHLIARLNEKASSFEPNTAFFEPLFLVEQEISEIALVMLFLGLIGRDEDAKAFATDALTEIIDQDRVSITLAQDVLLKLSAGELIVQKRLIESLATVSRNSDLHALRILQILETYISKFPNDYPRDYACVLELYLELCLRLQRLPEETVKVKLKSVTGGSKLAKTAKKIVALSNSNNDIAYNLMAEILERRKQRAERLGF